MRLTLSYSEMSLQLSDGLLWNFVHILGTQRMNPADCALLTFCLVPFIGSEFSFVQYFSSWQTTCKYFSPLTLKTLLLVLPHRDASLVLDSYAGTPNTADCIAVKGWMRKFLSGWKRKSVCLSLLVQINNCSVYTVLWCSFNDMLTLSEHLTDKRKQCLSYTKNFE